MKTAAFGFVVFAAFLRAEAPPAPAPEKLEAAINTGDIEGTRKLLDDGADPNGAGNGAPTTPLTFAALKLGDDDKGVAIVKLLLAREADPNLPGDVRPLYAAILRGSAREAQELVSNGADPDLAGCLRATLPGTREGESAKQLALKKGEPFVTIIASAKPVSHVKTPKKNELKRATLCSDH
jgi:hypothetical protein